MSVIKRVIGIPIRFGGKEHSGWLPPGASRPLPTPIEDVLLDIEIQGDPSGCLLCWQSQDGKRSGDTWHPTLEDAEAQAREYFGIEPGQWGS